MNIIAAAKKVLDAQSPAPSQTEVANFWAWVIWCLDASGTVGALGNGEKALFDALRKAGVVAAGVNRKKASKLLADFVKARPPPKKLTQAFTAMVGEARMQALQRDAGHGAASKFDSR